MGRPKGSKNKAKASSIEPQTAQKVQKRKAKKALAIAMVDDGADPNAVTEAKTRKAVKDLCDGGRTVWVRGFRWCFIRNSIGGKLALIKRYAYRQWDVEWVPAELVNANADEE